VGLASSLHEAGLVRLFQQLLGERHEPRVLHEAASLRHLSGQRLAALLARRLQSLGVRGVALGQRGRQVPDALSQLLSGGHAVDLWKEDAGGQRQTCGLQRTVSPSKAREQILHDGREPVHHEPITAVIQPYIN